MAAFTEIDWSRFDAFALLFGRGLSCVEHADRETALQWLAGQSYIMEIFDFSEGISPVVAALGKRLNWEQEFGYELQGSSRNLAALHDGFDFEAPQQGGLVLELKGFEVALRENEEWSKVFLSIISEHSLRQLALGRRFFAVIPVESTNVAWLGNHYEELAIPYPFPFCRAAPNPSFRRTHGGTA